MMNINYKKRRITKVVVKPNSGLLVSHEGERDRKGTLSRVAGELVCAEPDEEFTKAMKTLGNALVRSGASGHFEHALRQSKLEGVLSAEDLKKTIKECLSFSGKAVTVTKIAIKYDGEEVASVKIWGSFANYKGILMEVSSPQIELNTEALYGWEPKLLENVETVIASVKEFLEGKYSQFAIEEPKDEGEEEEAEEPKSKEKEEEEELDLNLDSATAGKRKLNLKVA